MGGSSTIGSLPRRKSLRLALTDLPPAPGSMKLSFRSRVLVVGLFAFASCAAVKSIGSSIATAFSNLQSGERTYYYSRGWTKARGSWTDDYQDGTWTLWFEPPAHNIDQRGEWRLSKRVGFWSYFYENGKPLSSGFFDNNQLSGPWAYFRDNGLPRDRGTYENGSQTHSWTYFHNNGQRKAEGLFYKGEKAGEWRYWDVGGSDAGVSSHPMPPGIAFVRKDGNAAGAFSRGFEKNGVPEGRWNFYGADKKTIASGSFLAGVAEGAWHFWDESGAPLATGSVQAGKPMGRWSLLLDGIEENSTRILVQASGAITALEEEEVPDPRAAKALEQVRAALALAAGPAISSASIAAEPVPKAKTQVNAPVVAAPVELVEETTIASGPPIRPQPLRDRNQSKIDELLQLYDTGKPRRPSGKYAVKQDFSSNQRVDLLGKPMPLTRLISSKGGRLLDLNKFRGVKRVLFVVLRGWSGEVCIYCSTQTKSLMKNKASFDLENTEIILVYPGPRESIAAFVQLTKDLKDDGGEEIPFTICFDTDLSIVEALNIKKELASPTSILLDEEGIIRFAYTGETIYDRPSASVLLEEVRALSSSSATQ